MCFIQLGWFGDHLLTLQRLMVILTVLASATGALADDPLTDVPTLPKGIPVIDGREAAIRCVDTPRVPADTRYALIGPATRLFTRADLSAPFVRTFPIADEVSTVWPGDVYSVLQVVAQRNEWVELTSFVGHRAGLCADVPSAIMMKELTFFALTTELQHVVTKTTRLRFDDGTALTLRAGLPVDVVSSDVVRRKVRIRPMGISALHSSKTDSEHAVPSLEIPRRHVGTFFLPDLKFRPEEQGDTVPQSDGIVGTMAAGQWTWTPYSGVPAAMKRIRRHKDRMLVRMGNDCATATAWVNAEDVEPSDGFALGGLIGFSSLYAPKSDKARVYVPAGTPLFWMDGTPAGQGTCENWFADEQPSSHPERRCFRMDWPWGYPPWPRPAGTDSLVICVPHTAVLMERPKRTP